MDELANLYGIIIFWIYYLVITLYRRTSPWIFHSALKFLFVLKRILFNPNMDKKLHQSWSVGWIFLKASVFGVEQYKIQEIQDFYWHNCTGNSLTKTTEQETQKHAQNIHKKPSECSIIDTLENIERYAMFTYGSIIFFCYMG